MFTLLVFSRINYSHLFLRIMCGVMLTKFWIIISWKESKLGLSWMRVSIYYRGYPTIFKTMDTFVFFTYKEVILKTKTCRSSTLRYWAKAFRTIISSLRFRWIRLWSQLFYSICDWVSLKIVTIFYLWAFFRYVNVVESRWRT